MFTSLSLSFLINQALVKFNRSYHAPWESLLPGHTYYIKSPGDCTRGHTLGIMCVFAHRIYIQVILEFKTAVLKTYRRISPTLLRSEISAIFPEKSKINPPTHLLTHSEVLLFEVGGIAGLNLGSEGIH